MKQQLFWKIARSDGWDWQTGKTINYRKNIGKVVTVPPVYRYMCPFETKSYYPPLTSQRPLYRNILKTDLRLCSNTVLHAATFLLDAYKFYSAQNSASLSFYIVSGIPKVSDNEKSGFTSLRIKKEIPSEFIQASALTYAEDLYQANKDIIINQAFIGSMFNNILDKYRGDKLALAHHTTVFIAHMKTTMDDSYKYKKLFLKYKQTFNSHVNKRVTSLMRWGKKNEK